MKISRALVLAVVVAGCGSDAKPIDVVSGTLTAKIYGDPAQIQLYVGDDLAWQTERGGGDDGDHTMPPHGFAAIGPIDTTVTMEFGSFKFDEDTDAEDWASIDVLDDIVVDGGSATFTLMSHGTAVGSGSLVLDDSIMSGPTPGAAGFPQHVHLVLAATSGERISLATPCGSDEHLVGMGGQSFSVDHRGETVPLWVQEDGIGKDPLADDDYENTWFIRGRQHSTHTPMPMLLSSYGYALALDTNARAVFALGSEDAKVSRFEAWEPTLDLHVFVGAGDRSKSTAGAAARDALGNLIAWVGKAPHPSPVVFAPWVDAIFGSMNVRAVAAALRANHVPASVIWTEDWRGGSDTSTGYAVTENWNVDRTLYPDLEQLADDLHAGGFQFLVYQNTFLDSTGDVFAQATGSGYAIGSGSSGSAYSFTSGEFTASSLLDLTNAAAVAWAKGVMGLAVTAGADGWMADFGEWEPTDAVLASGEDAMRVHNRYPVDWAKFNHDLLATTPAGRPAPIYFMRSAWIHSQPLVPVLWPGDQQTDFSTGDGFPSVVPIGLGLGLTGFPYFGSDIGGYMSLSTNPTDEELFYRWVTFGALSPVMRTHHGRSARDNFQWQHDAQSIAHFARWATLHMQLGAYLSGAVGQFERDGLPLFRMAALEYPDDDFTWSSVDEYLLGDRILVAPVQTEGATSRDVTLPGGSWVPLLGGASVSGMITADAPMTEIPAYVPAGSLLVLYPSTLSTVLADSADPAGTQPSLADVGGDREVWLYAGAAADPTKAQWNDALGVAGAAQWTWSGRPADAAAPTAASWNGASVTVTAGTVDVVGDGTLVFADGGTLVIARGLPSAHVHVRVD